MTKLIISLLVGSLTLQPPPALATETPDPELKEHLFLVDVIEQLGVKVNFGGPVCRSKPGLYGNYATNGSVMNLCEVGDREERLDTLRHEAAHVLQDMSDCSIRDNVALKPIFSAGLVEPSFIAMASKGYHPYQVASEAEAAWMASTFSARQINILLFNKAKSCGYKF